MSETDTIPRTTLSDLFVALRVVAKDSPATLELLRQHFCVERKYRAAGDLLWTTAVNNAQELNRLGLVTATSIPKTRRAYGQSKDRPVAITDMGRSLTERLRENVGDAYDRLFGLMFIAHPYLRNFVRAISEADLLVPVVTSLKDHFSVKCGSAGALVSDAANRRIDIESFLQTLSERLRRSGRVLSDEERNEISDRIAILFDEVVSTATAEEPTEFAKKFIAKLNDYFLPVLFTKMGLSFDYRTHQLLWSFGQGWKLWQSTSDHPEYDGRLVFRTATVRLAPSGEEVAELIFDSGLATTRENFLGKLYEAYVKTQKLTKETYVLAWQLRAVFCLDNRCQESVFERLMEEHYVGSQDFELTLEIQRQKGIHDRPLRVGGRNIGLVRVGRKRAASV